MEAYLYESVGDHTVQCHLCHHRCLVKEGGRGICGVRENRNGVLNTLVYDRVIAQHVDPIEKKPIFHLVPGSLSYSIATVGCNFKCRFCQNADIAQMPGDRNGRIVGEPSTPEKIVDAAVRSGSKSIAYTYTEPTVYFELAYETAKIAQSRGLKNVFVTNGYMSPEAIDMIAPYLNAANVDLKAFTDGFYKKMCGAKLRPVLESLERMKKSDVLVEVTTLVIPGLNDDTEELTSLAQFIATTLGRETPWHISRFHPTYRLTDRPATPVQTLTNARRLGVEAGLKFVYLGNVPGRDGEKTFCPACNALLIDRWGFLVQKNVIQGGHCPHCRAAVEGVWE